MPLTNSNYIAMFPLQEAILDKDTGLPLAAGYILFFEDNAPTVPKNVFVQTQAPGPVYSYTNIGSTVTLSSIGTTQYLGTDTIIFLDPYDANGNVQTYFIEVYSSTNILQFTRQNWPPGISGSGGNASGFTQSGNIISNPQFAEVLFNPALGLTVATTGTQTTPIAPDWNIITTGTGSFTVNQIGITDDSAPGEPAYALDIVSTSVDSIILSQRITNSPRILENNFASGTFIAEAISPTTNAIITMNYVPSLGALTPIVVGTALAGSFVTIAGTTSAVIPETNTNAPGLTGYVDIQFIIPAGSHIQISCIQLVSVFNASIIADYVQESVPRQIDHLYHYYNQSLQFKPIPSFLVGWDFGLNPAQIGTTFSSTVINSIPTWDQTILFSALGGNLSVSRASSNGRGAYQISCATANTGAAIIQYIDSPTLYNILTNDLSVNVEAFASVGLVATVSLWVTENASITGLSSAIPPITGTSLVTTLDSTGHPSAVVSGWYEITRTIYPNNATFTIETSAGSEFNNYGFTGWNAGANTNTSAIIDTAVYGAVVVGFAPITVGNSVTINSVSLVPGLIATRPAPQTFDEVLRACERYFEKSYANGTAVSSAVINNQIVSPQNVSIVAGATNMYSQYFQIPWKIPKCTAPTVNVYSPTTGNINDVATNLWVGGTLRSSADVTFSTNWSVLNSDTKIVSFAPANASVIAAYAGTGSVSFSQILYHYSSDARLGVV